MKALRVIFLACMIFALAGSAFAGGQQGQQRQQGQPGQQGGWGGGKSYTAPELDFKGPLKYELLIIAGAGVILLERRRRRRRASLGK
jgi:hypothetical protein